MCLCVIIGCVVAWQHLCVCVSRAAVCWVQPSRSAQGALARRYFETGAPCGEPALVPASAWLAGCGPEAQIQEHSIEAPTLGTVVTVL